MGADLSAPFFLGEYLLKKVSDYLSPDLVELIKVARLGDYKGAIKYSKGIFHAHQGEGSFIQRLQE